MFSWIFDGLKIDSKGLPDGYKPLKVESDGRGVVSIDLDDLLSNELFKKQIEDVDSFFCSHRRSDTHEPATEAS